MVLGTRTTFVEEAGYDNGQQKKFVERTAKIHAARILSLYSFTSYM